MVQGIKSMFETGREMTQQARYLHGRQFNSQLPIWSPDHWQE